MRCHQFLPALTRRQMLAACAGGFGQLALTASVAAQGAESASGGPLAPRPPHLPARAKRVIFLFMWGGPSHVDLFDPKPLLDAQSGKPLLGKSVGSPRDQLGQLLGSPFKFAQHGDSGIWISELFPELARHADRLCVMRSIHTEGSAHGEALLRMHTGQANLVRPSVGAWVSYGLGCESQNLPAFITISPPRGHGGVQNYGSAFLPAIHQGTAIGSAEIPIAKAVVPNLANPRLRPGLQQRQLELIQSLNQDHLGQAAVDRGIEGLIDSYELAFRMQSTMPQVLDLDDESPATLKLYGIGEDPTDNFGRQCLLARKFAERGVRYIQVSTDYTWDHHQKVQSGHVAEAKKVDRPIAGLLNDLARRGLLEDTLVLWGAEFGRTPTVENGDGRGHHPQAFSMWMAGGGVRGGLTYGATDDFGYHPVENPIHVHDLHATLLHALGLDHRRLTYRHAGREFRLTDVYGKVVDDVLVSCMPKQTAVLSASGSAFGQRQCFRPAAVLSAGSSIGPAAESLPPSQNYFANRDLTFRVAVNCHSRLRLAVDLRPVPRESIDMGIFLAFVAGLLVFGVIRVLVTGLYVIRPDQRAVLTSFGRAERLREGMEDKADRPVLTEDERHRYEYPTVRVIGPGGPYFKWPWQQVHKVSVATQAVDLAWDPTKRQTTVEAVTKDNLTTGVNGQLRFRVSENNLYAYLFGVTSPLEHVMGFFVSVLRERIANFTDPKAEPLVSEVEHPHEPDSSGPSVELSEGVSINDLRKNLPMLNDYMEQQCRSTAGRYGIELDAALITTIDPPQAVDRALSAINSTRNQVAADISTARADSEQQITMSKRAVEIARNNAQAQVAPLRKLAGTLSAIKQEGGSGALQAYIRNMRVPLLARARQVVQFSGPDANSK